MSLIATGWAFNGVRCKPDLKIILIAMADHADDRGVCWPGISLLAEKSGISTRTVKRKIKQLEELGVLTKSSRCHGYNKTTNMYRLHVDQLFDLSEGHSWQRLEAKSLSLPMVSSCFSSDKLSPLKTARSEKTSPLVTEKLCPSDHKLINLAASGCSSSDKVSPLKCTGSSDSLSLLNIGGSGDSSDKMAPSVVTQLCPPNHQLITNIDNRDIYITYSTADPVDMVDMSPSWRPSRSAFDMLEQFNKFSHGFIAGCIPAFVLYWMGRQDKIRQKQASFDALFIKHARVNYRKQQAEAQPIPSGWSPTSEVMTLLQGDGIPIGFIDDQILRFRVYWTDRGLALHSWSTVFLTWCIDQFERSGRKVYAPN